jgi:acetoin utilization deacetylase AcuC-like enzyme
VNVPVPKELEDNDIIHIYRTLVNPIVRRFRPELVLVAAGFDAHQRDPLGRTRLSEKAYRWLAQIVLEQTESARGAPLLLALEGGYDARSLAASVREVLGTLAFEGRRERVPTVQTKRAKEVLEKVTGIHREFGIWTT